MATTGPGLTHLHVHSLSRVRHPGDWLEKKHHPDHDLWVVLEGVLQLSSRGNDWTLRRGDGFLFPPKTPYSANGSGRSASFQVVHFGFPTVTLTPPSLRVPQKVPGKVFARGFRIFNDAWNQQDRPWSGLEMRGAFTVMLAQIIRHLEPVGTPGADRTHLSRKFDPVIAHMERNLNHPPSNDELASLTGMTVPYFTAQFKELTGVTPHAFFTGLRLGKGKDLLLDGRSVAEVAHALGYPDSPSFSKAFKKEFHISPVQFAGRR